jgi:hypothetical protein
MCWIFRVRVVMFGRDVEFIGDSGISCEGFEWDVSDHECCFEEFGGGRSGRERGLGIHFWVECKKNKKRRVSTSEIGRELLPDS